MDLLFHVFVSCKSPDLIRITLLCLQKFPGSMLKERFHRICDLAVLGRDQKGHMVILYDSAVSDPKRNLKRHKTLGL